MSNLASKKINGDFQLPDRVSGRLILILIIFLFLFIWSSFALMSAKMISYSFLSRESPSRSLAYSLLLELISNYFSPFTLISMGGLLLSFLAAFTSSQVMIKRKASEVSDHFIRQYLLNSAFFLTKTEVHSILSHQVPKNEGLIRLRQVGGPARIEMDKGNGLLVTSHKKTDEIQVIPFSKGGQVYLNPATRLSGIVSGDIQKFEFDLHFKIHNRSVSMEKIEIEYAINTTEIIKWMNYDSNRGLLIKLIADDFENFLKIMGVQIESEFRKFILELTPEEFDHFLYGLGASPKEKISKQKENSTESEEIPIADSFQKYPRIHSMKKGIRRNRKLSIYPFLDSNSHEVNNLPLSKNMDASIMNSIEAIEDNTAVFFGFKLIKIKSISIERVMIND